MEKAAVARRMQAYAGHDQIDSAMKTINWLARIDEQKVVTTANQRKVWRIEEEARREEQRKIEAQQRKELLAKWDANRFYNCIKNHFIQKNGAFYFTADNDLLVKAVCFFLSSDPRFETELGFSFNKGLFICGGTGLGKTETLRAVAKNPVFPIAIHSMIDIQEAVKKHGECMLRTDRMVMLDDVGTEQRAIKHYGTEINWFEDFIESYYHHHSVFTGLIITTNLNGDDITTQYGTRVRSRIREMMNVIVVTGQDLRK